jgi:hypothetical protein
MKALIIGLALLLTGCSTTDMTKYYEVQQKAIEADNHVVMAMAAGQGFAMGLHPAADGHEHLRHQPKHNAFYGKNSGRNPKI